MSELKAKLEADLKQAMLARDGFLVETLRGLKAAILNEEVAKGLRETGLQDEVIEQIFARESKKREEAAGLFEQGGNQTGADKERAELAVIERYLPAAPDTSQLQALVDAAVAAAAADGVAGPKAMGQVIKTVREQAGAGADGAAIAALVKAALAG